MPDATLAASREAGQLHIALSGDWTLTRLLPRFAAIDRELTAHGQVPQAAWNLRAVDRLDDAGAALLLRGWGWHLPAAVDMKSEHAARFAALMHVPPRASPPPRRAADVLVRLGRAVFAFLDHAIGLVILLGQLLLDASRLARRLSTVPWREVSANVHRSGGAALPVTALIGFLIGVVLSYLSALLLRQYGADLYLINVVGIGIVRELGPLLAAILVAGRSGSSMTAQLGVMRVTQELDALSVMGISHTLRLALPKVVALALTLPLLVAWTDVIAILGGALVAQDQLGIGVGQFLRALPDAVPVFNLWFGFAKAALFGALVALVACHYGLRIKPNTESLGLNTTASVVTAITLVIVLDAVLAVVFKDVGFY